MCFKEKICEINMFQNNREQTRRANPTRHPIYIIYIGRRADGIEGEEFSLRENWI